MAPTKTTSAAAMLFLAVAIVLPALEAQPPAPSGPCWNALQPMMSCWTLDSFDDKPSDQCCSAFKDAVKSQMGCVCDFYHNANAQVKLANITGDFFLDVSSQCGIANSTLTNCKGSKSGAANKVSSEGLIGLVVTLILMLFY